MVKSTKKNLYLNTKLKKTHTKPGVWKIAKLPDNNIDIWVPDTKDTRRSAVVQTHLRNGRWESRIAKLLKKHTKPDSVAVDVGAFIGSHSYTLSKAVGDKGKVYCIEPQPWASSAIDKTLKKNKIRNVVVMNAGISNKKGKIYFCSDSTGGSTICTEKKKRLNSWEERYNIDIITIDSLGLNNVSIMKIDVEGHEISVLDGARKTIKRNRPVLIIEVWTKKKGKYDEFKRIMKELDYNITKVASEDFLCIPK